jgi:hypothetical protein
MNRMIEEAANIVNCSNWPSEKCRMDSKRWVDWDWHEWAPFIPFGCGMAAGAFRKTAQEDACKFVQKPAKTCKACKNLQKAEKATEWEDRATEITLHQA